MQYLNLSSLVLTTTANLLLVDQLRLLFSTSAPGTDRTYWVSLKSAVSENRTPQFVVVPVTGDGNFARAAGFSV